MQAQNRRLLEERATMVVKFLVATQEKTQLAHQLKKFKGETQGVVKKRPMVEDNVVSLEDHQKIVAKMKKIQIEVPRL